MLEYIITQDPGLAAKVLRVASSPVYGREACNDIGRALSLLGMNQIKQISISLGYQQFINAKQTVSSFDRVVFWQHCKAVASFSRELMMVVNPSKRDDAYMAGLIHDVGILAMARYAPGELHEVIHSAASQRTSLEDAERRIGFGHKEIGKVLAEKWGLPEFICDVAANHDTPAASNVDSEICMVVAAANALAYEAGHPSFIHVTASNPSSAFLANLSIEEERLERIHNVVESELEVAGQELGNRSAA